LTVDRRCPREDRGRRGHEEPQGCGREHGGTASLR
jgi:hypothetical protein